MRKNGLFDYTNFWLIWLSCAEKPTTLFKIQKRWKIKTNYLYHKERGLKKPLFRSMIDGGFIEKNGKEITARFDWIPSYVVERTMPG